MDKESALKSKAVDPALDSESHVRIRPNTNFLTRYVGRIERCNQKLLNNDSDIVSSANDLDQSQSNEQCM